MIIIKRYLVSSVMLFMFLACNNITEPQLSEYRPIILDRNSEESIAAHIDWQINGVYRILYIGEVVDTLTLNEFSYSEKAEILDDADFPSWRNSIPHNFRQQTKHMALVVDTSTIIGQSNFAVDMENGTLSFEGPDLIYKSYPVFVFNLSEDTVLVGFDNLIPLRKQARDSLGAWRDIEVEFRAGCGSSIPLIMGANEMIVSASVINEGGYKTEGRLVYEDFVSNTFTCFINYNQFRSKYNAKGEYTDEYLMSSAHRAID